MIIGVYTLAEQLLGMCNICIHTIVFKLCSGNQERKKERKKERRRTESKFSHVVFLNLIRVSEIYTVDLAIE